MIKTIGGMAALLSIEILAGCGGGGGGGSTPNGTTGTTTGATTTGGTTGGVVGWTASAPTSPAPAAMVGTWTITVATGHTTPGQPVAQNQDRGTMILTVAADGHATGQFDNTGNESPGTYLITEGGIDSTSNCDISGPLSGNPYGYKIRFTAPVTINAAGHLVGNMGVRVAGNVPFAEWYSTFDGVKN
jgi:hypothetical protein